MMWSGYLIPFYHPKLKFLVLAVAVLLLANSIYTLQIAYAGIALFYIIIAVYSHYVQLDVTLYEQHTKSFNTALEELKNTK